MHQARVLRTPQAQTPAGHVYAEQDYVDARPQFDYNEPALTLRETLSQADQQRLAAINAAFDTTLEGKTLRQAQLRRALTAVQLEEFAADVGSVVETSEILYGDGMPQPLRDYNILLNKADLMWARYERTPSRPRFGRRRPAVQPRALEDRAESLYEDALERLDEIFSSAARGDWGREMPDRLLRWMDRSFDLGVGGTVGPDPHAVPRVRGSKSIYAHDSGLPKLSKRIKRQYCALRALLLAAVDLAFEMPAPVATPELTQEQGDRLRMLLKNLKSS